MMRRWRVLHLVDNLNFGGMERVIAELAKRTDPDRFDVHVLALTYLGHFSEGLESHAVLKVAAPMSRASLLYPSSLARDIRSIAPDIVHAHSGVWLKGIRAAAIAQVPYRIYTDHGRQHPDPWLHRRLDRYASQYTDVVVAVSEPLREHLATFVARPSALRVIANGVDTEHHAPGADSQTLRAELDLDPGVTILGSIGRLEPVKGYEVAIQALAEFRNRWPALSTALVLVGDGSARASLEALAQRLGVSSLVRFRGWRTDIERHLAAFDIFTMSSHSEGTSVSLLEAMSSQLCPIVSRVGGNPLVLGAGLAHRLVPPNDPVALATAWSDAIMDPARRRADAVTARRRVIDDFSLDAMVRRYEELYLRLPA